VVGEGRLPGKLADWSGSLLGKVIDILNPYRVSEDGSPLKCAVVNVPVRRGVVVIKDTVAGETDKVVGAVSGSVDLGTERLDLVLNSQAVGGLTPGLADFASAGKLTGTLAKPQLAVNVQGTAVAGLRIGAAIASLGVTLLAESAVRKALPAHPCQVALAAKAGTASGEEQPNTAEPQEKKRGFLDRLRGK
jgi:AsmA family protein